MDKNKNIDNKIKETFESLNKQAPVDLWNKFSDKLEDINIDKTIETKIKEGFDGVNKTAPPHVWDTVNKQLNIDRVWDRIDKELDRRPVIYWRNIAGIILLLFIIGAGIYKYKQTEFKLADNTNIIQLQEQPLAEESTAGSENNIKEQSIDKKDTKHLPVNASKSEIKDNGERLIAKNKVKENKNSLKDTNKDLSIKNVAENDLNGSSTASVTETVLFENMTSIQPSLIRNKENEIIPPGLQTFTNNTDDYIRIKPKKYEIGITYSYNNTWIINNETQKSFDANSLTQTFFAFASSYGVVGNYNFSKNNALSAEFYINSVSRQQYGEYIEGRYLIKTIQFNYSKFTLLYQLNLHQPRHVKIPSKYTIKTGLYASYLKKFNQSYDRMDIKETGKYNSSDYGIKLAFGQEKQFKNIIIGYGLNAEYGFNNTFAGNATMPAGFNVTKNALIGGFLNVKYNF